ncbi:hypothetical protein [Colwellia sp. MEBiC06753]
MHSRVQLLAFILFSTVATYSFASEVKVHGPQSAEDASHRYYISLIELALSRTRDEYPYQSVNIVDIAASTHGRSLQLLEKDVINVFWAGTHKEREEKLIPIRIPLFKGLLGYRVSIIRGEDLEMFSQLSEQELKNKVACQGSHWPDSDILENNGYRVMRVARFNLMFTMLDQKRCDYFPRAIFEGYAELAVAKAQYPDLTIFDNTILHYPFAIYLFTNKEHPKLAEQLKVGLERAMADGSLDELMRTDAMTKGLFPLSQWHDKRFFHLTNDTLPTETPIENKQLWLTLYPDDKANDIELPN